tara:strand:+ start:6262 stop:6507 length:246 start_codon:yes stop_codon:yes gene_type:complete
MLCIGLLALMLFIVWERSAMVQLGIKIEQMKSEKTRLEERQQALLVKYYGLVSPARLERIATMQLELMRPQSRQVILLSKR